MNILIDNFWFLEVAIESFNIIWLLAKKSGNNKSNDNNNDNNNNNNNNDSSNNNNNNNNNNNYTKTIVSDVLRTKQELR